MFERDASLALSDARFLTEGLFTDIFNVFNAVICWLIKQYYS